MTCPRCGQANPEGAGQCAACGTALAGDRTLTTGPGTSPTASYVFAPTARLAPGTLLGTRYEILSVLGEGGMGTVYKAQDRELGRLVALKVIRPDMAARPEVLERFKREILLASQITHRNVLRIHDLGEAGEIRFISMHYVEGSNLKTVLEREGPLPLERGLLLARQIGEALQAAHDAGIVHRDLKPQNILIDGEGTAYIADFGISRSLSEGGTMTETGTVLGTVDYMSPEQARGETPDHRGDIYSFGVILYEMFTGTLPFRAANALSVMMKRLHEDAPPIRRARPELPAWLSAIVARAMQRAPEDRYASAADLLRDLDRQRASHSLRRFARPRYWAPAAAIAVAGLLALVLPRVPWPPWGRAAAPTPRTSLVLLPFQNATGDPAFDYVRSGLPSLIRSELIEAKALRLVGEDRAEEVLASLKVPDNVMPSPTTSLRVASLLGAENVLTGKLLRIAGRLRIEASLLAAGGVSPAGGAVAASSPDAIVVDGEGEKAIFTMVDDLTRRVRDRLGVGAGFLERRRGATDLTTQSVEALSLYGQALSLARAGNRMEAKARLEKALEIDPQFHAARALLAETYDRLGFSAKAVEEARRAVAGIGGASPYEAARIRAVEARLTNDSRKAIEAYRQICEAAPNSAEAFFDLGTAQEEAGDLDDALRSLQKAVALDSRHASARYALGRVHARVGHGAEALRELNAALALNAETGNDEGRAAVLNGLGNVYRYQMGRPEEALRNYQAALEIRRRIGDQRGVGVTLRNLANIEREMGRYEEAIRSATEALDIGATIDDRAGLAYGYSELGDIYEESGRPEEALRAYQNSLRHVREIDDPTSLSRSLANVGYINSVLGNYAEAYVLLKEALAKRREIGDRTEIVRSLTDIGLVEQVQGRYEEALKYETEGIGLAREIGDDAAIQVLSVNLANIHEDQGEYGPALLLLDDARRLAEKSRDQTQGATCLLYQGSVRRRLGDLDGADRALAEASRLAREIDNVPLQAEILVAQASLLMARGQRGRAAAAAREAVAKAGVARHHRLRLQARLAAGEATPSPRDLEEVARTAAATGLAPIDAWARLALARTHLAAGRAADAVREADRARAIALPMRLRDVLFQASRIAGAALGGRGAGRGATDRLATALDPLEEMRQGLSPKDLKMFLERSETAAFARDALAVFQKADRGADAERLRALLRP